MPDTPLTLADRLLTNVMLRGRTKKARMDARRLATMLADADAERDLAFLAHITELERRPRP